MSDGNPGPGPARRTGMTESTHARLAERFDRMIETRAEHERLTARLATLAPQLREADGELARLGADLESERADVRRLEGTSPSRLWASVRGELTDRLERERAEEQAAEYAYARALRHREVLGREVEELERRRAALGDVEAGYEETLAQVHRLAQDEEGVALRDRAAEAGRRLEDVRWRRDLDEALEAGAEARSALVAAQDRLGSAGGWSAWDIFAGGGMLSSMLKHDELDRATEHLDRAAEALQRFSRELADVELPGVDAPMVDGLSRGLDIWFDNFFTDMVVGDRITKARQQVDEAVEKVDATLTKLGELRAGLG